MAALKNKPVLIEIKKYQNRRYYDTTNSQHLSLEKIHKLICQGHDIKVMDAKTEQDITTKILAQILLEYEPMKLDFFSPVLLAQIIRLNDMVLRDFYETYFNQALQAFVHSKEQFEALLRQSHSLAFSPPARGMGDTRNPFTAWLDLNPFIPGNDRSDSGATALSKEMEELRKQVRDLKQQLHQRGS